MSGSTSVPVATTESRPSLFARAVIVAIRGYQYALSWRRSNCRFWPTCSQYTLLAVQQHGAWRGLALGVRRIGRCHPWNPGGYDPVPEGTNVRSVSAADPADAKGRKP
ncbi:MAG: membrane protein insertion efficiency factor YidD [Acidimicrobiia bacterium]